MNNKVIKVLDREHGKKVIEFFEQYCDNSVCEPPMCLGGFFMLKC